MKKQIPHKTIDLTGSNIVKNVQNEVYTPQKTRQSRTDAIRMINSSHGSKQALHYEGSLKTGESMMKSQFGSEFSKQAEKPAMAKKAPHPYKYPNYGQVYV